MPNIFIDDVDLDDLAYVSIGAECPNCGEDRMDWLSWTDDDQVICATCGTVYDPPAFMLPEAESDEPELPLDDPDNWPDLD